MTCLPDKIKDHKYYYPTDSGNEKNVKKVLDDIIKRKNS